MTNQGQEPTMDDAPDVEDDPLYGISLRQYAAIQAAVAEGFPLDDVLRKERVMPYDWSRAERKWLKRFDTQKALADRLALEMAAAEDWLWRDIKPLQDDATAWATFYGAYVAAPQRDHWLARRNLGPNDITRLLRHWSRRAAADNALAQRLAQIPTANVEAPAITASPKVLKRARKGGAAAALAEQTAAAPVSNDAAPQSPPTDELDVFVFGVDRYAALCAELEVFPKEAERIRNKYHLATEADYQILAQRMREHLAGNADHERDYRRQHQLALSRARKLAETTTAEERAEANRKRPEAEQVKPSFAEHHLEEPSALDAPRLIQLPTVDVAPPELRIAPQPAIAIVNAPPTPAIPQGASGATQDVSSLFAAISEPALPFAAADPKATPDEVVARIESTIAAHEEPELDKPEPAPAGGTQDVDSILAKMELPSGWKAPAATPARVEPAPAPAAPPRAPEPAVRPPEPVVGKPIEKPVEKPAVRPPEKAASPTKPPAAVGALPELTIDQYAYLCIELEARPDRTGEILTRYGVPAEALETVHAVWRQRLAYDPAAKEAFRRVSMDYKVWQAGQTRTAPRLTVEQFASLIVDLSLAPAKRGEILQRYGLDEAAKAALDHTYQHKFQADPQARATFEHAMATYRAWVTSR